MKAPKGWPSDSTLRARRIVVVPDLRELLSDQVRINHIAVEGAYLSALRPKEGGGLPHRSPDALDFKEARNELIRNAAYSRAAKRGVTRLELEDWLAAEAEVDSRLNE
jgi:hypothetical protein